MLAEFNIIIRMVYYLYIIYLRLNFEIFLKKNELLSKNVVVLKKKIL